MARDAAIFGATIRNGSNEQFLRNPKACNELKRLDAQTAQCNIVASDCIMSHYYIFSSLNRVLKKGLLVGKEP